MTATLPDSLTPYQKLAYLQAHTGIEIKLRPFEKVVKVTLGDQLCGAVLIETYRYDERAREYRFTAKVRRLIDIRLGRKEEMIFPDDTFQPFVLKKFDFKTAEERLEQREWERLCHRPAGDRDSHSRLAQGYVGGAPKGAIR